jgi:putative drug exporter of the RND superfamily
LVATLARWCFKRRWIVLASWIVVLLVVGGISQSLKANYSNDYRLPKTDSSQALSILQHYYPQQAGDTDQIVVQARTGKLQDPAVKARVDAMLAKVATLPHVVKVTSPYVVTTQISKGGTIGFATVNLNQQGQNVTKATSSRLIKTAQSFENATLNIQLGGAAIENGEASSGQSSSEAAGIIFALIILFFAFRRSVLCAVLPLISALMAIGIGTSIIGMLTHALSIPEFGPILAVLVALGVGVDYALFIVTRHRNALLSGKSVEESVVLALNTSGRAVFVAGLTVCIALLGMFVLQVSFLYGVALSAALVVVLTMLASLTLLPALLGFFGVKVLRRGERRHLAEVGPIPDEPTGFWDRWSKFIGGRSSVLGVVALGIIVVLALPFFSMRLGLSDAGNDPAKQTSRQAYDLLAEGFGPGFNGPFTLVAEIHGPDALEHFQKLLVDLKADPGVASVGQAIPNPAGTAVVGTVYPTTAPQDAATVDLLNQLRHVDIPRAEAGTTLAVHVGGVTAGGQDFSHILSNKLPEFVGVVVILAFLLLAATFRSLVIPLTASIMNLLSIGAALGVMTATFQWGWGRSLLNLAKDGPIDVFVPVLLFAVLFGLSMDYEVFLVSRMHEEWTRTHDNRLAVQRGQAETGRVITAAALIMIFVFASFVFGGQRVIEEVGIGFASAVLLDAFVIRTVLVPALMHLFGGANWWLPGWLDRILPRVHVESSDLELELQSPEPVGPGR